MCVSAAVTRAREWRDPADAITIGRDREIDRALCAMKGDSSRSRAPHRRVLYSSNLLLSNDASNK